MPKKFTITMPLDNWPNCKKIQQLIASLFNQDEGKKYVIVIKEGEDKRSDKQRRLQFLWLKEIDRQTHEGKEHIENYCKWHFGFPVLIADADDESINAIYSNLIDNLLYEQIIQQMSVTDVTKLMTVRQNAEYLQSIEEYAASRDLHLTHPDDLYLEALMKMGE